MSSGCLRPTLGRGVVRAFSTIDKVKLEKNLIAFEQQHGIRIGIDETDLEPSVSSFLTTSSPLRKRHSSS